MMWGGKSIDDVEVGECNLQPQPVVVYQDGFVSSVEAGQKGKETQGREIVAVSQVWGGSSQTGIVAMEKRK